MMFDLHLLCSGFLNSIGKEICANELYHPRHANMYHPGEKNKPTKTF